MGRLRDRPTILVVEDNALNLKLVRDVLSYAGYRVLEATTGEDGIRLAHEEQPGPGADGPPAARASTAPRPCAGSARPDDPPVPVVAVTAFAMPGDRDRAMRDGFDGYLEKPLRVRALPHQVARLLAGEQPDADPDVTVLAVDDQPAEPPAARRRAEPARLHRADRAPVASEALEILAERDVDVVLLDIVMPGMDGYEVCRRIRAGRADRVPARS